jgi:YesN/AraC family two-component response regulator
MTRVLIVDDNPAMRRAIRKQIESAGLEVCGEAADGLEAIEKAPESNPHVVIMDVAMPRLNGVDAARAYPPRGCDSFPRFAGRRLRSGG